MYIQGVEVLGVYTRCGGIRCIYKMWRYSVYIQDVEVFGVYTRCGGIRCIYKMWRY